MAKEAATRTVTCAKCHKRSQIMEPDSSHPDEVVWQCPAPRDDGDLCGHANSATVS